MIENNAIFRRMIEEIEDYAILLLDKKGNVLNWNKGAEKIKGYSSEEIIGKNVSLFYPIDEQGPSEGLIKSAVQNGKTKYEGWLLRKDGSKYRASVLITVIQDESGEIIGFSNTIHDLTGKMNTEEMQRNPGLGKEGFLKILDASPSGMIIADAESRRTVQINRNFIETFGYSKEDVLGFTLDELGLVSKERREKLADRLKQQGFLKNEQVVCVTKDGREINCIISADIFEMDGRRYILSMYHDISGRLKAEETERALLQSREGWIKLFNASPTGMIMADIEKGRLIEVNESFLSIFKYRRNETIGFTADELGFVSTETQVRSFTKLKQQGYLRNEEVPAHTKEGKRIDTLFSVELFEMEGQQCFLCIFHDISEIKEMERKLVESENKYRKLIEEAGDVLYTSDASGNFTYINQRVTNLTGYSSEELLGKHFSILIAPEWQEKVKNTYLEQFKNKTHETVMEFLIHTKTGKEKWVEQIVIMQRTKDVVNGFQCIVHDITERKKANLLLAEQKKIIELKNKNILDSINYAKRIQDTIFPPDELIRELLPQSFVLFKPKDVIGGDFYWLEKFDNKIFIAAVDCTGHGVPGALLSIIGYNLLSKSINERGQTRPSDILNDLSNGVNKTLRKNIDNYAVKDTMDIALCSIDLNTNMLEFAGAHNSLYVIRKSELIEIPADRFPIGITLDGELRKFTNHKMQLEKGDTIYLFSDGYPDQFGGPEGKKLKYNGFKKILLSIQDFGVYDQKKLLDQTFEEWKRASEDQTDDILIMGVKV